jgi:excisionase family DNA binding protein
LRRFEEPLRRAIREATGTIQPLSDAEVEDVLNDFWVRLVDADMRWLRRFRGGDQSLEVFLRFQVLEVAQEHLRRLRGEQPTAPLTQAPWVADGPSAIRGDVAGLAALLQLPVDVQALRGEVAQVRAALDQLRRALPPALLSVPDAARALGVAPITVRRMIRSGKLAHVRIGRSVKVDLTRTPVESTNLDDGFRTAKHLKVP